MYLGREQNLCQAFPCVKLVQQLPCAPVTT